MKPFCWAEFCFVFVFRFICHIYPPFTRKRIVSLYLGREVRTRLGVAFFEVYGSPVFHVKVGHPVKCLAQGRNKRTCRLVLHNLSKIPNAKQGSCGYHFLKSFGMTQQGGMNPWSTDCEADALTTTPSGRFYLFINLRFEKLNFQSGYWSKFCKK